MERRSTIERERRVFFKGPSKGRLLTPYGVVAGQDERGSLLVELVRVREIQDQKTGATVIVPCWKNRIKGLAISDPSQFGNYKRAAALSERGQRTAARIISACPEHVARVMFADEKGKVISRTQGVVAADEYALAVEAEEVSEEVVEEDVEEKEAP